MLIAGHRILGFLGQGGFGITYKARSEQTGTLAALKEYFPVDDASRGANHHVVPKQGRADRFQMGYDAFLKEARTLKSLPNQVGLVKIQGAFEKHRTVYSLMEFIDGKPLDRAMQRVCQKFGHVPVHYVQDLAVSMLSALRIVHEVGVLHRDIKPANIMIRRDGQPVLIDFGAARPMGQTSGAATMYSRRYAALEQFPPVRTGYRKTGEDGPATDIFALSVVLYEMVSQSLPVAASDRFAALRKTGQDPYLSVRENLRRNRVELRYPDLLLDAIDAGCALLPEDRPSHAAAMASRMPGFVDLPKMPDLRVMTPARPDESDQRAARRRDTRPRAPDDGRDGNTVEIGGRTRPRLSPPQIMFLFILMLAVLSGLYGYLM